MGSKYEVPAWAGNQIADDCGLKEIFAFTFSLRESQENRFGAATGQPADQRHDSADFQNRLRSLIARTNLWTLSPMRTAWLFLSRIRAVLDRSAPCALRHRQPGSISALWQTPWTAGHDADDGRRPRHSRQRTPAHAARCLFPAPFAHGPRTRLKTESGPREEGTL